MRALTVVPGQPHSALLDEIPEADPGDGAVVARTLAVGVCGTDREILAGNYGWPAPGYTRLVLGHESLSEVLEAPRDCGLNPGDLIAAIVRRPDPVPCESCLAGEWDMCRNGRYTECGIKERDGFCRERFRIAPEFAVPVQPVLRETGILLEPGSVVAKAWDHIERIGHRAQSWTPKTALITGAGTIGLLAALMARQRCLALHVYDRDNSGQKRSLVEQLGGRYHTDLEEVCRLETNITVECTGASEVIARLIGRSAPNGIVCLAGLSSGAHRVQYDFTAFNRSMVLENTVVFGTVNANRRHYVLAADALARADRIWLGALISRRVALSEWPLAIERQTGDIKVVIDFTL